jgi:hypothetical protein
MNLHALNSEQLKANLSDQRIWIRLVYMLLFALMLNIAALVIWGVCVMQFIFAVATGRDNANLRSFGAALAHFIHQALDFVSFNSEEKPFPFAAWPSAPDANVSEGEIIEMPADTSEDSAADTKPQTDR